MGSCRLVCVKAGLFGGEFSHAISLKDQAMGVMDEPIQDGVGDGRIGDQFVPVLDGELAGHDGGGASMPVVEDLQEITLLVGRERRQGACWKLETAATLTLKRRRRSRLSLRTQLLDSLPGLPSLSNHRYFTNARLNG